MFGFVVANNDTLSQDDRERYKSVYCGLCRSLKERHGQRGRLSLNYDMTFLVLVLSSLYEPEERFGCERCFPHPVRRHSYSQSEISAYAADMNVALAYLNQLDNWRDDKNILSLACAKLLEKSWLTVSEQYPRQCGAMEDCVKKLSELEATGEPDPDVGARLFGRLLGEIFVYRQDRWESALREMAGHLGEFIYIMDAVVDLDKDMKKGRYNPLAAMKRDGKNDEFFRELLTVLIGDCTIAFERLPLVDNMSLMRNILCSGVWTRLEMERVKKARLNGEKRR